MEGHGAEPGPTHMDPGSAAHHKCCAASGARERIWQLEHWHRYIYDKTNPWPKRGSRDASCQNQTFADTPARAAPAAFFLPPWHHHDGRLRLAQGCELARGAARAPSP